MRRAPENPGGASWIAWFATIVLVLVLGSPPDPDPELGVALKRFRKHLQDRYGLSVETIEEHLTTREARAWLREQRSSGVLGRRARKGEVDSLAACLIARDWQETAL